MADFVLSPEGVFLICALLTGVLTILLFPVGAGLDEPSHVERIEQIAKGEMTPVFVGYAEGYEVDTDEQRANASLYGGTGDNALDEALNTGLLGFQAKQHDYAFPTWSDELSFADVQYGSQGESDHVFSQTQR